MALKYTHRFFHTSYFYSEIAQSYATLCDPIDYTVHEILQARILEWVAVPLSRDLPNPGIEPRSPSLQEDSLPAEPPEWVNPNSFSLECGLYLTLMSKIWCK